MTLKEIRELKEFEWGIVKGGELEVLGLRQGNEFMMMEYINPKTSKKVGHLSKLKLVISLEKITEPVYVETEFEIKGRERESYKK